MRVLLIEDDRLMARSLALMLNSIGVEHETVAEGEAAIELARVYDYDAILLDLNLPDLHGYEVLRRLRLARVATPVMILSGESEVATKVSGFGFAGRDGAVDALSRHCRNSSTRCLTSAVFRAWIASELKKSSKLSCFATVSSPRAKLASSG